MCNAYRHWQKKGWHWCQQVGRMAAQRDGARYASAYCDAMATCANYAGRPKANCTSTTSFQSDWLESMGIMMAIWESCVEIAIYPKVVAFLAVK
jgi:hypothetical protein